MAMTDYVIRERLPELWRQIDNTHFSYLETDDSPEKLDQRKKLEGYILDYLCLVPHESKFFLAETGEVLSHSSATDSGFSGYRQARGWAALARYAANLLAQPWRKEYRTIRLYSGFYKHEVESAGLVGGSSMLRAMGYRGIGAPDSLSLDGPVCPDQVAAVSRDSLIAYVECQIMIQIWEEASVRGGTCSWHDVLLCREAGAGDVASSVEALLHTPSGPKDIYCNVKFPGSSPQVTSLKQNLLPQQVSTNSHQPSVNGHSMQPNNHVAQQQAHMPPPPHPPHLSHSSHPAQPNGNAFIQNGHSSHVNTMPIKSHMMQNNHSMPMNNHSDHHNLYCANQIPVTVQTHQSHPISVMPRGPLEVNPMYGYNTMAAMNHYTGMPGYYYNPMPPHPYVMQQPIAPFAPVRQATTLPLINGYHCPVVPQQQFCPTVPTGQLIELDIPNYGGNRSSSHHYCSNTVSPKHSHNTTSERTKEDNIQMYRDSHKSHNSGSYDSKNHHSGNKKLHDVNGENQENIRRNSAPRTSISHSNDHTHHSIPRSDTQPSLSKAREDGMGTFESWDYVFRNLESQGYSKDLGERGNILSPPLERDSKTLGRIGPRDSKRYHQTTMDLEDALHALSLEKNSDEEVYRTAKINETLQKIKQENEAKAAKASFKRQILADEREKRKSNSYDHPSVSPSREPIMSAKITDKTRLISKEDAKDKKEIDKTTYVNGNTVKALDTRKARKSIAKCLSSESDKGTSRRKSSEQSVQVTPVPKKTQAIQGTINHNPPQTSQSLDCTDGLKTRLVVTLREPETCSQARPEAKKLGEGRWQCGTCTFLNGAGKQACEMCGKSKQVGPETLPLISGGKECPACTLVNQREASVCAACDTSLKHSPTYI